LNEQEAPLTELPMADAPRSERRDAAANRARILEAARQLLAERGPHGLTMESVAAAAGVGKGTVFRRFGDRSRLAAALVNDQMREFQDRFLHGPPPLGPGAPAPERLEAFVVELLHHYVENLPVATLAATELDQYRSDVMSALLFHVQMLVRQINPRLDDHVVAAMILGAISPPLIVASRQRGTDERTLESSARALLRGITPEQTSTTPIGRTGPSKRAGAA